LLKISRDDFYNAGISKGAGFKTGLIGWLGLVLLVTTACGDNPVSPTAPTSTPAAVSSPAATTLNSITGPTPSLALTPPSDPTALPSGPTTVPVSTGQAATPPGTPALSPTPANAHPYFDRVFTIVLENADYAQAIAQPYLKKLAGQGVLLTNYSGVAHPSYPNYLALVAGSTFGLTSDGQVNLDRPTVMDLMNRQGISWKFYAEQYPEGKCFTGVQSGNYVRKHLPALSFVEIQKDPAQCSRVVPATQLAKDISSNNLPDYSFYVPDLKNDGHDTGVAYASKWLEGFLGSVATNQALGARTLLVVTFDESDDTGNNRIYTVLGGPVVKPGLTSDVPYTHFNLLRTIEDNFHLGNLGQQDATAAPITGVWQNAS
jgi:acid phosphatase